MKNLVALLCMITALVGSVESLKCNSCLNRIGDSCDSEDSVDCGDVSECCTVSGFIRFNSTTTQFIRKGCPYHVPCGQMLSITGLDFDFKSYIDCCEGENCIKDYYIPMDNDEENGYVCQSCYEDHNTEGCVSKTKMKCSGNSKECVEYKGTYFKPDGSAPGTSFMACATKCGLKNLDQFLGIEEIERVEFKKNDPIDSPYK